MTQIKSLRTGIKFKDTPIGKIPVDWDVRKVENIGEIVTGSTPSTKIQEYFDNKFMFVTPTDIGDFKYVKKTERKLSDKGMEVSRKIPKDSVMVVCIASIGKLAIASEDCTTNQQINSIICNETTNPHFIYYLMCSKISQLLSLSGKTAVPIINKSLFSKFLIQLPHLEEQKKIAEILTTLDDAIEETDRIIEKTKELKKGLMQKLLTRGIGHKKFKKTEIGKIPEEWEMVRLGNVCDVFGGSTPSTAIKEYWDGNILWATPTDITNLKGRTIEETKQRITEKGLQACSANLLPEGSILMTSRATIGACAINTKPMATNQGFASLVCKERVYNWFVYYLVLFFRGKIERLGSGSTFKEVSKKSIRSFYIPLPSFSEQKEIADILTATDLEIDSEENNKQNLETLKKSLMQVLLTGRVRVKLQ